MVAFLDVTAVNTENESPCHLALSVVPTTSDSGLGQLQAASIAIVAPAVASEQQHIRLVSQPLDIAILETNGSPSFHYLMPARFARDLGAIFPPALTGGIATFGQEITSFPLPAAARTTSATFNLPATSVTPANAMAELRNLNCVHMRSSNVLRLQCDHKLLATNDLWKRFKLHGASRYAGSKMAYFLAAMSTSLLRARQNPDTPVLFAAPLLNSSPQNPMPGALFS